MHRLSIVTIVFNHAEGFRRTAASVKYHRPDWVEWTVIDGQSTDGTVEVIQEFSDQVDHMISEPDRGIAEAFNKGVRLAGGNCLLFLNAGDELQEQFYEFLGRAFMEQAEPLPPVLVGRVRMDDRLIGRPVSFYGQKLRNKLPHQAMVIRRDMFDRVGLFREDFSLGMDYEWSLRLRNLWPEILFSDRVFAIMEPGGISMLRFKNTFLAYHRARMEHGMARIPSAASTAYFIFKVGIGNCLRMLCDRIRRR